MNTTSERYTAEDLLVYAKYEPELTAEGRAMLRQAASDATHIATLEAEVAALRKALTSFSWPSLSQEDVERRAASPSSDGLLAAMALDARAALTRSQP